MVTKLPIVRPGFKIDPKTGKKIYDRAPVKQLTPARRPGEGATLNSNVVGAGGTAGRGAGTASVVRKPTEAPPAYNGPGLAQAASYLPGGGRVAATGAASPLVNTGSHGGVGGATTTPLTGFAANFDPAAIPAVLSQPELILQALMQQRGQDPLGAGTGMMALGTPYMDALSAIMPLAWGGGLPPTPSSPINWMAKMGQEGMRPGGAAIDFRDVVGGIGGLDPASATAQGLWGTGMTPQDQVNATKQIVYGAAQAGMPAAFQRAIQNMMNQQALAYMQNQYTGGTPSSFQQFMPNFY